MFKSCDSAIIPKMERSETSQDPQNGYEEDLLKRSPFHLFMTQIQRIKSSVGKGKHQHSSVIQFFRDLDPGGKSKGETEREEIDLSRPDNQNEKPDLPASDEVSHNISETDLVSGKWKVKQFMKKLGKKPNSKNMDLNNCALNETDLTELSGLLPFLPELEEINLSWNDFIGGTLKPLTLQLHHVSKLKSLRLNNCRMTAEDIASLGEALEIIPFLEELDLSWNSNIGGKLSLLTKKIQKGSKIKILKVIDCNLAAKDGESLAQILNVIHHLKVLDLSINQKIGCSLKSIAQELKNVSGLEELHLHMCGVKKDGLQSLGTAFQYLLELRKLDLSCNKEIGRGFEDSAAHLASLKDLEVLDLHQCCITEEDLAVLTQVIPLLSSLQELNLSSNKNIGMSSDHLLSRLRFLPKLNSVIISNCSLQKASFASLAEAALHLPDLEILDLSWNKCVGGNLKLLLEALKLATEIRVLILSSCNLAAGDLALLALLMRTGHLAKLQKLDLSYNDTVCDEGWATFYQDLAELKELSELDVSLRPSSCRDCGMWFGKLLTALREMPAFTDLGMQRWVFSGPQQKQLEYFNQDSTRNVRFDY
ncbi:PREDICTED: leucine-rich repeat-containing protein 31 isoform X1 [Crocodylus porosus]|uniref:Leucine rich repeat containing 31 n=2 Tax=Crocodylus porosus TaxID=8502 RepID=A0A7M4EQ18_CROPO|nr:PREDICTED: leucine-rich repeat-containing protein 31 isoform X1 [Crocodylus porosus]